MFRRKLQLCPKNVTNLTFQKNVLFDFYSRCDQHVLKDHKISLSELKTSKFIPITNDGLYGLIVLQNGKVICSACSIAFSNAGNGKRHFMSKHSPGNVSGGEQYLEPGAADEQYVTLQ